MNKKIASEIAIGVIVLIAIIIGGIFYWQSKKVPAVSNQQTVVNNKPVVSVVEQQQAQTSEQSYIEVREFGIKIPADSVIIGDLTYVYKKAGTDNVLVDMVTFSSKSLTAVDKNCGIGSGAGPTIQKIIGTPSRPAGGADPEYYTSRLSDIKQFNGYFLVFMNSQDSCTMGKHVDLEKKLDQTISTGFKNAELINQDETANWQTYTNTKYGFEFKYPKDWKTKIEADNVAEDCNSGTTSCNSLFPEKQKNCGIIEGGSYNCVDTVAFGIIKNKNKLQLRDFLEKQYGWTKDSGILKNNDIQQTKFGNGFMYKFIEISGFNGSEVNHFWVTLDDGNFFNMIGSYLDADEMKIFNQIVSSFKFTK